MLLIRSIPIAFCVSLVVFTHAYAEPIRILLNENDTPLRDSQVVPAQYTAPATQIPYRPFSLSLDPEDKKTEVQPPGKFTPISPQGVIPVSLDVEADAESDTNASPLKPTTVQPIPRIRLNTEANPAAPQGTPVYRLEASNASRPTQKPESVESTPPISKYPQSRFSDSDKTDDGAMSKATPPRPTSSMPAITNSPAEKLPSTESPANEVAKQLPKTTVAPLSPWNFDPAKVSPEEVAAAWGEPQEQRRISIDQTIWVFKQMATFQRVEVGIESGKVTTLYAVAETPFAIADFQSRLQLSQFDPAIVVDQQGRTVGTIFPERGVMLPGLRLDRDREVASFIVQTPSAEAFLVRAQNRSPFALRDRLNDLDLALVQKPYDASAWHEKSKILARMGKGDEAFEAARKATSGVGSQPGHRLHRALLAAQSGQVASAIQSTRQIVEDPTTPSELRARAFCQWGDLLQQSGAEQNRQAVTYHMQAIETANPLVNSSDQQVRREAKRVLIDAHLALAVDIATGDWEKKDEIVSQWLHRATLFVDDMIDNEDGTPELELKTLQKTLMARSYFDRDFNTSETVDRIMGKYRELSESTEDPFYRRVIEWETGVSLTQAVFVELGRGRSDTGVAIAKQCRELLDAGSGVRQLSISDHLLLGNLNFRVGAVYAVQRKDHASAVAWYDAAHPHLLDPTLGAVMQDRRGESLVSMGVSFWEAGQREKGIDLSEQGKSMVEAAVNARRAPQSKLLVPLSNLAKMYQQSGQTQKSTLYTASAAKIQQASANGPVSR